MDSKHTVTLVVEVEGHRPRLAVEYPLSGMQLRLIAQAARKGMQDVPDMLRVQLEEAISHVDRAASSAGA